MYEVDVFSQIESLMKCHLYHKQVYEVDVFEHHRFCDEFSHLVIRRFLAFNNLADLLSSCQLPFISDKQVYEVDVFEHHRFCDESHLVIESDFHSDEFFLKSLMKSTSVELMF